MRLRYLVAFCLMLFSGFVYAGTTYYVDDLLGSDTYDGLAPAWDGVHGPKKTIKAGIKATADYDKVSVARGTYKGEGNRDLETYGLAITIESQSGPASTVIDCEGTHGSFHRGFGIGSGETYQTVISGFTIKNGYVTDGGGAIYIVNASPTIWNCIFENNYAGQHGGAIHCHTNAEVRISKCTFRGNSTNGFGGALSCTDNGDARISNCNFQNNYAGTYGGAVSFDGASPIMADCVIGNNDAVYYGGGIFMSQNPSAVMIGNCDVNNNGSMWGGGIHCSYGSLATISNCLITNNAASDWGGGITFTESIAQVKNCTIADNSAPNGPGVGCDSYLQNSPSTVSILNTIIWNGTSWLWNNDSSTLNITYSCIQGGWAGTGNISGNPLFLSNGVMNYCLSQRGAGQLINSPCYNSGSGMASSHGLDAFSTRTDRITDSRTVDMGYHAYMVRIYNIIRNGSGISIAWNSLGSIGYTVQRSTDMSAYNYTYVGETGIYTDNTPPSPKAFYKIRHIYGAE